ncbi:hypothetical protein ABMA46_08265 [Mesorhizobium sp. CN5-321]|jgi:hypothetical protein
MDNNEPDNRDHVVIKSAWVGNVAMIALVVIILGAALAYKEFF